MSLSYSIVVIAGRATEEPELKYAKTGTAIANFDIATNNFWTDKSGAKKHKAVYVSISAFGRVAETIGGGDIKKGTELLIEGKLDFNRWVGKDGVKRKKLSVIANKVLYAESRKTPSDSEKEFTADDEDVPF